MLPQQPLPPIIIALVIDCPFRRYSSLELRWSPEQISGRLKLENKLLYVSHKAIYSLVYLEELEKHLRRKGRKLRSYKILW